MLSKKIFSKVEMLFTQHFSQKNVKSVHNAWKKKQNLYLHPNLVMFQTTLTWWDSNLRPPGHESETLPRSHKQDIKKREHYYVENVQHVVTCYIVYVTKFAGQVIGKHKSIVVVKRFRAQKTAESICQTSYILQSNFWLYWPW